MIRPQTTTWPRFWALFFIALTFMGFAFGMIAPAIAAEDFFAIENIQVDVTSSTAAQARAIAIDQGQKQALKQFLQKITREDDWVKIDALPLETPSQYVRTIQLQNEKTSAKRYIATLSASFHQHAIETLLGTAGIPYVATQSRPVLLLPVLFKGDGPENILLWEDQNDWLQFWKAHRGFDVMVPITVPLGDLNDIKTVSSWDIAYGNRGAFQSLLERYNLNHLILAQLVQDGKAYRLEVVQYEDGKETPTRWHEDFTKQADQTQEAFFAQLADMVHIKLDQSWKSQNLIYSNAPQELTLRARFDSIQEWSLLREHLNAVGLIKKFDILQLNRNWAELAVSFVGTTQQLQQALLQQNLLLAFDGREVNLRLRQSGEGAAMTADDLASEIERQEAEAMAEEEEQNAALQELNTQYQESLQLPAAGGDDMTPPTDASSETTIERKDSITTMPENEMPESQKKEEKKWWEFWR